MLFYTSDNIQVEEVSPMINGKEIAAHYVIVDPCCYGMRFLLEYVSLSVVCVQSSQIAPAVAGC